VLVDQLLNYSLLEIFLALHVAPSSMLSSLSDLEMPCNW